MSSMKLKFEADDSGKITGMKFSQPGGDFHLQHTEAASSTDLPTLDEGLRSSRKGTGRSTWPRPVHAPDWQSELRESGNRGTVDIKTGGLIASRSGWTWANSGISRSR